MKAGGAEKDSLGPAIAELVALKAEFERATGTPFDPPKKTKKKKAPVPAQGDKEKKGGKKVGGGVCGEGREEGGGGVVGGHVRDVFVRCLARQMHALL